MNSSAAASVACSSSGRRIERREMLVPAPSRDARAGAARDSARAFGGPLRIARVEQRQVEQPLARIVDDVEGERAVARAVRRLIVDDEPQLADAAVEFGQRRSSMSVRRCVS